MEPTLQLRMTFCLSCKVVICVCMWMCVPRCMCEPLSSFHLHLYLRDQTRVSGSNSLPALYLLSQLTSPWLEPRFSGLYLPSAGIVSRCPTPGLHGAWAWMPARKECCWLSYSFSLRENIFSQSFFGDEFLGCNIGTWSVTLEYQKSGGYWP